MLEQHLQKSSKLEAKKDSGVGGLRKERKRTHRSFVSHKSPKTRKKNVKEHCVL